MSVQNEWNISGARSSIYVYCDIVQSQVVGDTIAKLLRSVPIHTCTSSGIRSILLACFILIINSPIQLVQVVIMLLRDFLLFG